jgi:hypothetical protein
MVYYNSILTGSINIPVLDSDPPYETLNRPGLIWYNSTVGALRYTYNVTDSNSLYCVKTVSYT